MQTDGLCSTAAVPVDFLAVLVMVVVKQKPQVSWPAMPLVALAVAKANASPQHPGAAGREALAFPGEATEVMRAGAAVRQVGTQVRPVRENFCKVD